MKKEKSKIKDIGGWIAIICLFVFFLLFAIRGVQCWILLAKWDHGGVIEYSGSYTFSEKKVHGRRTYVTTIYKFVLDNGDIISNPGREYTADITKFVKDHPSLTFQYSSCKNIFTFGEYTGISVVSTDKNLVFLNEEDTKRNIIYEAILYPVIVLICTVPFCIFFLPIKWILLKDEIKSYKRRKAKRRKLENTQNHNQ